MKKGASLSIIFVTVFIDLMGFGILIPILPTYASKVLNIDDFGIGIIIAIFSLIQFLFNPFMGRLSDKIGRRPVIMATLLITSLSYLMFTISNSFLLLFLSRVLAGFGGSNIGVAQAYMADITTREERAKGMGLIGAAFGLGFLFGPIIGGILSKYGYQWAGYGSSAFSLLAFIFSAFFLPESNLKRSDNVKISFKIIDFSYTKKVLKYPSIGFLILFFFIIVFSMANIYGTFSILGYKFYHFTDQQNGYLFGLMGLVSAIIQGGAIQQISKKINDKLILSIGTFIMMIGLAAIPYGVNFTGVALIVSFLSIGTGMLQPTVLSMISRYSPEHEQGLILGINQSFSAFGRVLGPLWGGFSFHYFGYYFPFLTGAAFTLVTFLFSLFYFKNKKHP